ncbi:MAG: hypothetical protein MUW57_16900 [Pseudomonas sp.]|nr:hypothetical protein [Pseudomonas sp.]
MRVLNVAEIEAVSGAGFFSRIGASVIGGIAGLHAGAQKGGVGGGASGGILGVGVIGALVGAAWGSVYGLAGGALFGLANDWDVTLPIFNESIKKMIDWTAIFPNV